MRHKTIGRIVIASLLGSHVTAAVIAYRHIISDTWAEKVCLTCSATQCTVMMLTHVDVAQSYFITSLVCFLLQVTGIGFAVNITASMYTALAGVIAAIRRDIPTHRRNVIRMIGLAYGVFPTKYIWVVILAMSNMVRGEWVYPLSVCLSTVTGVVVTEWALLGKLSGKDMAHDKHADKNSTEMDAKIK